jgi:hypothetical protein
MMCSQVDSKAFTGLMVRLWDKHTFRRDGFLGQVTIKFNTDLLDSEEAIDQWFVLKQRGGKKEDVSGSVHLRIHYGDYRNGKEKGKARQGGGDDGVDVDGEDEADADAGKKQLALSSNYHKDDPRLKQSMFVQIDEEEAEADSFGEAQYEPARKGKAELAKLNKDTKVTLASKNLEVSPSARSVYTHTHTHTMMLMYV